jgi:hypothetical protein
MECLTVKNRALLALCPVLSGMKIAFFFLKGGCGTFGSEKNGRFH